MPLTPEQAAARAVEREARETRQLIALHGALGELIAARQSTTDMFSQKVLRGDFLFAKALHDLFGDDCSARQLECACDNYGVDAEGNDLEVAA